MKKAYAVIGANFGDEGKGLMTDLFCRNNKNVLNIRSNGGAQAGHTVCTEKGERHVFSHLGAGSFAGADTYLSEFFILNPMLFMKELASLGGINIKVFADKKCRITLPCDMLLNQYAERNRGEQRHGSCGLGIYETVLRSREFNILYGDIKNTAECRKSLAERIKSINEVYCARRAEELGIADTAEFRDILQNENITLNYIDDLMSMIEICEPVDEQIIEDYETAVFEGAQGLLLDMERRDYFPNLTPSNTGMKNIRSLLDRLDDRETEICYVTRSYFTRHGAGRFDTEYSGLAEEYGLFDKTNAPNEFQGMFRYGRFDLPEFMGSLAEERKYRRAGDRLSIAVTHLDMTEGMIICPTGTLFPEDIAYMASADKLYRSFGETAGDIICTEVLAKTLAGRR